MSAFLSLASSGKMAGELSLKSTMTFAYGEPAEMAPGVVRLVANNPGPFTFKGTNTYLVRGRGATAVIDPGPDDAVHREAILKTTGPAPLTHIFITHAHRDHVDGARRLADATGALIFGHGREGSAAQRSRAVPRSAQFVNWDFAPDRALAGGERIDLGGSSLTALYTPGHAPDHLCLVLDGRGIVFSGDHVMAWNTTVIAPPEGRMADYLASLEAMLVRDDLMFLPGHGGRLAEPQRMVKAQLLHRRWREQAVLDAIRAGAHAVGAIVPIVYKDLDARLAPAAALTVEAHVEHLVQRGLVTACGDRLSASAA